MARRREVLVNLGVSAGALVFILLVFELIVFRFVLPGTDLPTNAYVGDVIRYAPNQRGTWRVRDDIAAPFAINAQGWNSGSGDYVAARTPGALRIAVLGDSYVEALQVPHDQSLAEHVARAGAAAGRPVEAYRFALSGAPMSQYLHMAEREVAPYRPDWIVVVLVANDYAESFRFAPGRYTSAFRKLEVAGGRVVREIAPTPWAPGWADAVRQLATVRFLQFRWQVRPERLAELFAPAARADPRADVAAATRHVVARLKALADGLGASLLVVTNADVAAIQAGHRGDTRERRLHAIATAAAAELGVTVLSLEGAFARDFAAAGRRLDFPSDAHWNARAHALAGAEIARVVLGPAARAAAASAAAPIAQRRATR